MRTYADAVSSARNRVAALIASGATIAALLVAAQPAGAASAPTAPGAITISNITMNSATVTWGASTDPLGIVGYQVYRQTAGGPFDLIGTTDTGIKHYTATHLYGSTQYTFQVVALDSAPSSSAPTTSTPFTTLASTATAAPAPPSSSSVAAHAFSDSRIDVVWGGSTSADVSGYLVLRDGAQVAEIDLPAGLRYSDNGLAPASSHTYTIQALDSSRTASTPTAGRTASTLPAGTVQIARGPYVSDVTSNSAIVSWWTNIPTTGRVEYGTPNPSTSVDDTTSGYQHTVTLTGLVAGTAYQYTVGTTSVRSPVATFATAAPSGSSFSFAAIGDFGGASPGESQNAANIASAGTSFIQTVGDNIYPSAGAPDPDFSTTYSDFDARLFKQFGPALRNQAFFPANGNQEYYSNGAFWQTFPMPGTNHSWYSYDWGNAHISVLDSQLGYTASDPQYGWLQSDLAAHQSSTWRIVVIQDPAYSSTSAASSSKPVQQNLVPLFQQQHVSLVLSGNSHNYERSNPLTNGTPAPGGITYIVTGGGGNGHNAFQIAAPAWSAQRDDVRYEYVKVTVSPQSLTADAVDAATDTVFDSTTIQASSTAPGAPGAPTATLSGPTGATLTWTAPTDNGGSPITGYTVTASPAGPSCHTSGATSCTVANLTRGTTYTFTVRASNAVGAGPASAASNAVTPPKRIPTAVRFVSGPTSVKVGASITLTGALTRTDTSAGVSNQSVQLRSRPANSTGSFTTVRTTTSSATGSVTFSKVVVSRSTQYILRMVATATYAGATSAAKTVTTHAALTK